MKAVMIFLVLTLVIIMAEPGVGRMESYPPPRQLPPNQPCPSCYPQVAPFIRFGKSQDEVAEDRLRRYYED